MSEFISNIDMDFVILGFFLLIVLFLIGTLVYLIISLRRNLLEASSQNDIPSTKVSLITGLIITFLFVSLGALLSGTGISSILSWGSACLLALFLVVLQDFYSHKSTNQIEEIHKIVNNDSHDFLKKKFAELEERDKNYQKEITLLKNELQKSRTLNINLNVTDKKSMASVLEKYLMNK